MAITLGIIHTAATLPYTRVAIASLRRGTPQPYRLVVVDNDGLHRDEILAAGADECLVPPGGPASFAQNANRLLLHAPNGLVLLNNDILFTPGWLEPLQAAAAARPGLISPLSNWDFQFPLAAFTLRQTMLLEEVAGHEDEIFALARQLGRHFRGQTRPIPRALTFACYMPAAIGRAFPFDEGFVNGGEDEDLTIRAHLAGVPIYEALSSFILHFGHRSFSAEAAEARARRYAECSRRLIAKWGTPVATLIMTGGQREVLQAFQLEQAWDRGEFGACVRRLRASAAERRP